MLTIFGGLALWFRLSRNGAIIIGIILVIFASLAFFLALYRTLFFRVLIDKDGHIVMLTRLYNEKEFAALTKKIDEMLLKK